MAGNFNLVSENPNHNGGCLCDEQGCVDTRAPYASFYVQEMESILAPIPVICGNCLCKLVDELEDYEEKHAPEV